MALREAKDVGLSDRRIAVSDEAHGGRSACAARKSLQIVPVYKRVDTCGAEFESFTPVSLFDL
jgi:carbamoyl-phosphate synthase large subunit